MRVKKFFYLVLLFCFFSALSVLAANRVLLDGVAAYVNENIVTIGDVQAMIEPMRRQLAAKYSGKELSDRLTQAFNESLNALIDRYLILDAYSKSGRKLPEWVINDRIEAIIKDQFGGDRSKVLDQLSKENMSWDDWRKEVENQIIISYMRQSYIDENIRISPSAIKEYYEKNKSDYSMPEKVKIRMIMIAKNKGEESRKLIDEIAGRIRGGEDFASLAVKYSEDPSASKGGDWDWIEPRLLRADIASACAGIEPGGISGVVETTEAFYLIKLEGRKEASVMPLRDAQSDIEKKLRIEESKRLLKAWVARLRESAYIKILPLAGLDTSSSPD